MNRGSGAVVLRRFATLLHQQMVYVHSPQVFHHVSMITGLLSRKIANQSISDSQIVDKFAECMRNVAARLRCDGMNFCECSVRNQLSARVPVNRFNFGDQCIHVKYHSIAFDSEFN